MDQRKELGDNGEALALEFLQQKGYGLVEKNYRCRQGEIDLIVTKESLLVFVEVRSKSNVRHGEPSETVNLNKQKKIKYTAELFLLRNAKWREHYCRFDVISVVWNGQGAKLAWIPDAFR